MEGIFDWPKMVKKIRNFVKKILKGENTHTQIRQAYLFSSLKITIREYWIIFFVPTTPLKNEMESNRLIKWQTYHISFCDTSYSTVY